MRWQGGAYASKYQGCGLFLVLLLNECGDFSVCRSNAQKGINWQKK